MNDARMEVRLPDAEKRAVFEAADKAGQVPSVYVRRVLSAALAGGSIAPAPVEGESHRKVNAPPAQPRTPAQQCGAIVVGSGTDTYDQCCELSKGHRGACKSTAAVDQHRLAPARIAPVRKVKASTATIAPGALRVHTPNCKCAVCEPLSATKPRPKAATRKTKP